MAEDISGHQKETVSLRDYLELKITALEERLTAQAYADQMSVQKAALSVDARLDKLNELRQIVVDLRSTFTTIVWSEAFEKSTNEKFIQYQKTGDEKMNDLAKRVNELETFKAVIMGKASMPAVMLSIGLGLIALILGIANVIGLMGN